MVILDESKLKPNDLSFEAFNPIFHREYNDKEKRITWNQYVRGFFTWNNAQCMVTQNINLTSYRSVSLNVDPIYDMVSKKKMPPGDPWPDERIAEFKKWRDDECPEGDPIDSEKHESKIMDPPLQYKFEPFPDIAKYNEHIKPLFTACEQKIAARDYNNIDVKQYEQFKKAASDYQEKGDKNIVYDIFNNNFPKGNRWPDRWKDILVSWIGHGFEEGEPSIYEQDT
jgi:hypothetical protein